METTTNAKYRHNYLCVSFLIEEYVKIEKTVCIGKMNLTLHRHYNYTENWSNIFNC
jgi:hypothetical protein